MNKKNINKKIEIIKKEKAEILELTIGKNLLDGLYSRSEQVENKISKLCDKSIEITHSGEQKEKK